MLWLKVKNTQQDNISYDDNVLYSIPQPRFYERSVILKSIIYNV